MRSFMLKKLLLAGIVLVGCAVGAAESYIDCIKQIEKWMIKEYSQTPIAYDVCKQKLADIVNRPELTEEQKISQLKAKFPNAFVKEEKPLVFKTPLTWNIHSLSLGYDFKESASSTTREVDVFKEVNDLKHKTGKTGEEAITKRHALKAGINSDISVQANVSFNPFKWLDSGASGKIGASGSYAFGRDSVTQSSELWSASQQQTFAREQSRISEMLSQRGISNFHLTFTVTLTNNTAGTMYCDLAGAYIPVYMGSRACNKTAKPYEHTADRLEIEPWRTKDVVFRMELDTTTARDLARFMAENAPTIDIMKGGNLKIISTHSNDVIGDSQKRIETGKVKLRLPGLAAEWNIRLRHTSDSRPVTLREAFKAAGEDMRVKLEHDIFTWQGDKLIAVSDIPVASFAKEDTEERYAIFMQVGDQAFHPVTPELLEKSLLEFKSSELWIIDLNKLKDYKNAPSILQEAIFAEVKTDAEEGDTVAQYRVSVMFFNGIGTIKNLSETVNWWCKSANQGHAWAQWNLGGCYEFGEGVPQDEAKAFEWYSKAAEQGHASAQFHLGRFYEVGKGVVKDEAKAFEWYSKAANQGNAWAQWNLGRCYEFGKGVVKDEAKAFEWYSKAAEQGHAWAQLSLGLCYNNGIGVVKDETKAFEWYSKAAEQGLAMAQLCLGLCYDNGIGVVKDEARAFEWYNKAAEQGDVGAQWNLGLCYDNGIGVVKDEAKAFEWYSKAANQGHAGAQWNLGRCYEFGKGVNKDEAKAFEWYSKAANQGHAGAQCHLGVCYDIGIGVVKDEAEAVKWYRKAAEQGLVEAQYNLGSCCRTGKGVDKDEAEAVKWYRKAADQGLAPAQYILGVCYENGYYGLPKDGVEAVKWYRKAAEQGNDNAKAALKRLGY